MSNNTANTIKTLMSNTSATKRIALYTQWKAGNLWKTLMAGTVCLAHLGASFAFSIFMFWVKLQIVIWMFG